MPEGGRKGEEAGRGPQAWRVGSREGRRRYDGKGGIMKQQEARNRGKNRKRGSKQKGRKDVCQNRHVRGHQR